MSKVNPEDVNGFFKLSSFEFETFHRLLTSQQKGFWLIIVDFQARLTAE